MRSPRRKTFEEQFNISDFEQSITKSLKANGRIETPIQYLGEDRLGRV